uniref:Uncharacterized protein n=1 Tax=Romanomermis culicivorax TaxID=13658 RepID=A0A915J189_ROMCU
MAEEDRKHEKKTLAQYEQILDRSENPFVIKIWSKLKETIVKEREIKFTLTDEIPTSIGLFAQKFREIMQEHKDIVDTLKVSLDKQQESCRMKLQQFHVQTEHDVHRAELKTFNLMKELENDVQDLDAMVRCKFRGFFSAILSGRSFGKRDLTMDQEITSDNLKMIEKSDPQQVLEIKLSQ